MLNLFKKKKEEKNEIRMIDRVPLEAGYVEIPHVTLIYSLNLNNRTGMCRHTFQKQEKRYDLNALPSLLPHVGENIGFANQSFEVTQINKDLDEGTIWIFAYCCHGMYESLKTRLVEECGFK